MSQGGATLETLPVEIHMHILRQITDQNSLISAALSSKVLHQSYLAIRLKLLSSFAKTECDELCIEIKDAITVIRSRGLRWVEHEDEAVALLDTWRRSEEMKALKRGPDLRTDQPKDLNEVSELFTLVRKLRFFVEDFTANSPMPPWIHDARLRPRKLAFNEQRRLVRALCRLQIHANILGIPPKTHENGYRVEGWEDSLPPMDWPFLHGDDKASRTFFCIFPPWELEEMCSALRYLGDVVKRAYLELSYRLQMLADTRGLLGRWCDVIPLPFWLLDQGNTEVLDSIAMEVQSVANFGPEIVYRIVFADSVTTEQHLMIANLHNVRRGPGFADWLIRHCGKHWSCPLLYPADRYQGHMLKDLWDAFPSSKRPNAAWQTYALDSRGPNKNEEEYSPMGNPEASRAVEWCYAIWDDSRLERWNFADTVRWGQP